MDQMLVYIKPLWQQVVCIYRSVKVLIYHIFYCNASRVKIRLYGSIQVQLEGQQLVMETKWREIQRYSNIWSLRLLALSQTLFCTYIHTWTMCVCLCVYSSITRIFKSKQLWDIKPEWEKGRMRKDLPGRYGLIYELQKPCIYIYVAV